MALDGGDVTPSENRLSLGELEEEKSFETIRAECQSTGIPYDDLRFPAVDTSLYFSANSPHTIEWMRPTEIAERHGLQAEMFVGGTDVGRFAIRQGELGCSSVVAALAVMSENNELIKRLVTRGQSFQSNWYAGVFSFRFWRHELWEEVVIDDRLPVVKGDLIFVQSLKRNEFWPSLLEKAYAKLMGSYESLRSCSVVDVIRDFTGGIIEFYCLEKDPPSIPFLVNAMLKALERHSLIGCCINIQDVNGQPAAILSSGLITGQQYNITDLREIKLISEKNEVPLSFVRVRNPWGKKSEWKGPWNEKSEEWNSIASSDRKSMGLLLRDDAEFWMDLKDFMRNFDLVEICNLAPDGISDFGAKWVSHSFSGKWTRGVTGGGRPACKETHWLNPQFKLTLNRMDNDNDRVCTFVVQLEQKCFKMMRHQLQYFVDIGFVLYKCTKDQCLPLPKDFFQSQMFVGRCDFFSNSRIISKRFVVDSGNYVIVPSTYKADIEASFILTVFTEKENIVEYVDVSTDIPKIDGALGREQQQLRDKEGIFQKYFNKYAGDDGRIDVFQFQQLLVIALKKETQFSELGVAVCKSLQLLVDKDCSGKLSLLEFLYLWNMVKCWKKTFCTFDKSNQGTVNAYELRSLVATLGYRLSAPIASRLVFRYSNEQYLINLESFISCMSQILNIYEAFKKYEKNGKVICNLEEWLEVSLTV